MAKFEWSKLTREDVEAAIQKFLDDTPTYPLPRSTFLIYNNKKLPAKHIRGMAYQIATGKEISKEDYTGGMETVKFFNKLGFDVLYKDSVIIGNKSIANKTKPTAEHKQQTLKAEQAGQPNATEDLKALLNNKPTEISDNTSNNEAKKAVEVMTKNNYSDIKIKIGLYLQTKTEWNKKAFDKAMQAAKNADFDILVFPEDCYCPRIEEFWNFDITKEEDMNTIFDYCLELSEYIDKAIVLSIIDFYGTPYSIFANYKAQGDETCLQMYIKHTMAQSSAFDFYDYGTLATDMFKPIIYKGYKIGLTICYDCNHSIFSRMWSKNGADIIINSTGGDVVFDKWYKYNKARAIENQCYNFVTMGGEGVAENPHTYVYGFNREGKELPFTNLMKNTNSQNEINTIYVFDTANDDGKASVEHSYEQAEKENKKSGFDIPVGNVSSIIAKANCIKKNLYSLPHGKDNIIFCIADNTDIMQPELVLNLMYAKELKKIENKKYIIVNRHSDIDEEFFKTKLSVILKVRSMENYCAVIFESNIGNHCYQCGNNRTAQIVKAKNGVYGIDLSRTGGGETIWKNKPGMRASWRTNFEWLIEQANL